LQGGKSLTNGENCLFSSHFFGYSSLKQALLFHLPAQKAGGVCVQPLYSLFVGCLVESLFYSFPMEAVKFRRIQPLEGFLKIWQTCMAD